MIDLRARGSEQALAAMAINNGVGPVAAADWSYLGYKGGSENGVLSMSLLGQRKSDGKWFVVTASWNNQKAPDVRFTLVSADSGIDFTEANLDLAIFWTDGAGEREGVALAEALMVTVAGPGSESETRIAWPGCPVDEGEPALRLGDEIGRAHV